MAMARPCRGTVELDGTAEVNRGHFLHLGIDETPSAISPSMDVPEISECRNS